jgi:hypothetical protein
MASFTLSPEMKSHASHVMKNPQEKAISKEDRSEMMHFLKHARDLSQSLASAYIDNEWLFEHVNELELEKFGLDKKQAKAYKNYLKDSHKFLEKVVTLHSTAFQDVETLWMKNKKKLDLLEAEESL